MSIFEALDNNNIVVTQSSSYLGWYFYHLDDMEEGNVAAADRTLYDTPDEAGLAAIKYYKIKL
jgi:hypothetical protein